MSDWDRLGGEGGLRPIVQAFVRRFADDLIIGFLFVGKDLDRIAVHELGLASVHLGGPGGYHGQPIHKIHRPLHINGGQFRRRLALLRLVLREHRVPDDIIDRWVEHDRRLQRAITDGTDCAP